ncbi:MAG: phenylalanine--tRNA ligase subunit alpha [Candidatus Moranbacteria bacterium RIFOXYA12_FULL_35_19]|nr:MAG: phenylalanine--tRNA ligase subunit alpha [Candidatus Moranbacteria bacterium RIFOXYC12_FULL_36_13]OGI36690.1 MAG: phenylalanine--tRNA ligase subunit alpha [Candidatus Moranbacteria bacterium RIFOXYA12_FULL_35_19]
MLKEKIENLKKQFLAEIEKIKPSEEALFELEKRYVGRKSEFISILKNLKNLTPEERRQIGELANNTKNEIFEIIKNKKTEIESGSFDAEKEKIDVTIPGKKKSVGHFNPISLVRRDIEDVFTSMGYEIADGPEIENEWYNFDALNIPKDHPARDMQDTFWLRSQTNADGTRKDADNFSMRSQTSAVQARYMEKNKPPLRIIVPGKCFRREATDTTHEHTFYQFEALIVGEDVNVGNLKFTAKEFFSAFFKQDVDVRLRPSYFPFTEPSFEFDISCTVCGGKGCKACKWAGWLELGGAGMVNQNVFVSAGYPRNKYQGFAWGFGLERLAMTRYKIDDVRLFHSGDLRFVKQF